MAVNTSLSTITPAFSNGLVLGLCAENYDRMVKIKTNERNRIASELEKRNGDNTQFIQQGIDIFDLTQRAAEIFKEATMEDKRLLLGDIFSSITLNGKHMKVDWRPETKVIRKAIKNTDFDKLFLELDSDPSKKHLTKEVRSTWLGLVVSSTVTEVRARKNETNETLT